MSTLPKKHWYLRSRRIKKNDAALYPNANNRCSRIAADQHPIR
jgi:hypothetical protein